MSDLERKVRALQSQYPSWEDEAIRNVLMDCGGDMALCSSTIEVGFILFQLPSGCHCQLNA